MKFKHYCKISMSLVVIVCSIACKKKAAIDPQQPLVPPVTPVTQIYPSYNTSPIAPDMTGMTSTAVQQAANMQLGLNIGNTLEATGGETAWGNPPITNAY